MNKTIALALFGLGVLGLGGCFHYREAREDAFAARVAEKCVDATRPTQVIVVPASSAVIASPPETK